MELGRIAGFAKAVPVELSDIPFGITDWQQIDPIEHAGEVGVARWRTKQCGAIRVRPVEYTPGYQADHWCRKGHILFCVAGELETDDRVLVPPPARAPLAAFALANQPFGFTPADVELVQAAAAQSQG
jgi:hypothetical protein